MGQSALLNHSLVAQLVERSAVNRLVAGSSPAEGAWRLPLVPVRTVPAVLSARVGPISSNGL